MLDAKVFSCKMRLFQKSEGRKWAAMGRTCLRSPFCPRIPWPGSSTLSLAGGAESGLAFWGIQRNCSVEIFQFGFILALLIIAAQTPIYIYFLPHFGTYLGWCDVQDNHCGWLPGSSWYWRPAWWGRWTGWPAWLCSPHPTSRTSSSSSESRLLRWGLGRPGSIWSRPTWSWASWWRTRCRRLQLGAMRRFFFNLESRTRHCFTRFTSYFSHATLRWSRGSLRRRGWRATQWSTPTPGSSFLSTMTSSPSSCLKYSFTVIKICNGPDCLNDKIVLVFPFPLPVRRFIPSPFCGKVLLPSNQIWC